MAAAPSRHLLSAFPAAKRSEYDAAGNRCGDSPGAGQRDEVRDGPYDPTVACVTILSSWPYTGRRAAPLRACLAGTAAAVLAVLLAAGGPGYLTGIRATTTGRVDGTDTALKVFADAWSWIAVVVVPAVVCAVRRRWPQALLLAVLALSALLALLALLAPTD
jgi:hypothetical protein